MAADLIVGTAPPERAGAASGLSETSAELGGALGIAVLGSVVNALYRGRMETALPQGLPTAVAETARDTLGAAAAIAAELAGQAGVDLLEAARTAFTDAVTTTSMLSAGLAVVAAIVVTTLLRDVGEG
jgi:DHA2 family multidrug resistance protein-like MFS transporter